MNSGKRKDLTHQAFVKVHAFELQAFYFFVTLSNLMVEIDDQRAIDGEHYQVTVSMSQNIDPDDFIDRWKEWQKEELNFEYALLN